jgi:ATP-dependent DNA helicase PIF1
MTPEQEYALSAWRARKNIFVTGQGGTGKSALIKCMYEQDPSIHVTALTGCAAILLGCGARTLHSWAGLTATSDAPHASAVKRWRAVKTLVIDEVSMLSAELFESLDRTGRRLRKSNALFGGIQLVLTGDFFQLPPVEGLFCFKSALWNFETILLTTNFRQTDPAFQDMLTQIRNGKLLKASVKALKARVGHGDGFTRLVPTRAKADRINQDEYAKLPGTEHVFAVERVCPPTLAATYAKELDALVKNAKLDAVVLKVGTRVMCTVNLTKAICNGSQGVVQRFERDWPVVNFQYETIVMNPHMWSVDDTRAIGVKQLPLIHAWAITIHKSQGATLDTAEIDIGKGIFEAGQTYVALSRVKSFAGLFISELDFKGFLLDQDVVQFYSDLQKPI